MKKIDLIISDVDGTVTDGRLYYNQNGYTHKVFQNRLGDAFNLIRQHQIPVTFITSGQEGFLISKKVLQEKFGFSVRYTPTTLKRINLVQELSRDKNVLYLGDSEEDYIVSLAIKYSVKSLNVLFPKDACRELLYEEDSCFTCIPYSASQEFFYKAITSCLTTS